ncbi:rhomboid family intramembrane serine protease [Hamadaea sp.]|uniref:rhomboid family intramembrane serine protease n=1 Tax=Hamadaea sp. TaxID=2024425 RepID=UPI0025C11466|nr:rhomboid family intramembrane serine protease [Hamadaea sp.]
MKKIPWLTGTVLVVTAAVNLWAAADADVMRKLGRDPAGFSADGWWHLFSSLFVQSDGWAQLVFNLLTLAVFGYLVEVHLGRWRWSVLYLGAGLLGQALGYAWEPPGGGNSVAVCGLVGGLATAVLLGRGALPSNAGLFASLYAVALAGSQLFGWIALAIGVVLVTVVNGVLEKTGRGTRILAVLVPLAGLVLLAGQDHHGASLLFGVLASGLMPVRVARSAPTP